MVSDNLSAAWGHALEILADTVGPATISLMRRARPLANIEGTILIAVPDAFVQNRIETHALSTLIPILSELMGREIRIHFTVDPLSIPDTPVDAAEDAQQTPSPQPSPLPQREGIYEGDAAALASSPETEEVPIVTLPPALKDSSAAVLPGPESGEYTSLTIDRNTTNLNPKYTFDTFVMGPSNRFAHATAFQVAESPGQGYYNPLFMYGDSGLGKTHLLHAIGHYALTLYPHLKVRYVNSEEFTNDFINSIREGHIEEFQRRYRQVDLLLIDDIQFIGGKEQTMEEFFHTFNSLYNLNKQIVMTSDLPPAKLSGIEDRLRSRFAMGLMADIQAPDLETRIAILQKKAQAEDLVVNPDVLDYIASRISANVRELEGALLRVTAYAQISQQEITTDLAAVVLKHVISDPNDSEITANLIMAQTANYFGFSVEQLCSSERARALVEARQIAMYLCRDLTDLSLPKIGEAFGGRDHTTVIHAHKKIQQQMPNKKETYTHVTELTNRIKQAARNSA
ncbi:chromosomal replication initiator protein DnaA [Schaalia sp. Marseille-Q2122]|uniref:chromosomal replication initiator protein DnaA n=1 Tax=Schaalia sp. Marseille-Q2122 TaxID=2736604 RepID=UPI00158B3FA5|nr:chromosomal replication initiator protein DnaA [Schaalia sp. Marseille-Q2122]